MASNAIFLAPAVADTADQGKASSVSKIIKPDLPLIMSDSDWMGNAPEKAIFSDDNKFIFYQQKRIGNKIKDWFQIDLKNGTTTKIDQPLLISSQGGEVLDKATNKAFSFEGDIYVKNSSNGEIERVTRTSEKESSPRLIGNKSGSKAALIFWQGDSLLSINAEGKLDEKAMVLLADAKSTDNKSEYTFLKAQQQRYFASLKDATINKKLLKKQAATVKDNANLSKPFYLGKDNEILARDISPNGEFVALLMRDKTIKRGRRGKMAHFVTDSGYVEIQKIRTVVGENGSVPQFLVILDLKNHLASEVSVDKLPDIKTDRMRKIRIQAIKWHQQHGASKAEAKDLVRTPSKRAVSILGIEWSRDNKSIAIMYRAEDNKDRWIATIGLDKKSLVKAVAKSQHQLVDKAWINWLFNSYGWLPDGRNLWYQSEESGFSHLYLRDTLKNRTRQLTAGKWEVNNPVLSKDGKFIYFRANKIHPGRYEIYRVNVQSKVIEQLTDLGGSNTFKLSSDEKQLLIMHSTITRHPEIYLKNIDSKFKAKRLTFTVSKKYAAIKWIVPEIVPVPSSHVKNPIYTKVYKPQNFSALSAEYKAKGKKFPAVVFVHGAGYTQNSHYGWAYYYHELMFHTLLVNQGYLVIDMDYRGSKGYGRDWRTAIYRNMGHPEVEDLRDGVNWMVKNLNVDAKRVGVYGGSYGGFLTFMSLFRDPELFAAGAALRPVADWAHYNHGYTSNILNTPDIDPMAFEKSSPIEFVKGLNKPLLIASGMLDDNVFFQDSVRLVQRLIELKKQNFEIAIFPMEHHGFKIPSSWLDEYRRIYKLMEANLK